MNLPLIKNTRSKMFAILYDFLASWNVKVRGKTNMSAGVDKGGEGATVLPHCTPPRPFTHTACWLVSTNLFKSIVNHFNNSEYHLLKQFFDIIIINMSNTILMNYRNFNLIWQPFERF